MYLVAMFELKARSVSHLTLTTLLMLINNTKKVLDSDAETLCVCVCVCVKYL